MTDIYITECQNCLTCSEWARTSWKLAVSDWQSMPSHVTNPLESQGIVTRNGGEG